MLEIGQLALVHACPFRVVLREGSSEGVFQNKVHKGIEIKTIALEKDPANLRLFEAFYIRKYNLPSTPEKNAANSRTFYSNNYFNTSRDSSYFDTHSLDHSIHFYSYIYISCYYLAHAFTPTFSRISHVFTLHLYISLMRNIFLIPDDAVDRRKLGFYHYTILQ